MSAYKHNSQNKASHTLMEPSVVFGEVISMTKEEKAIRVGAAIRTARKRRGKTQKNIADHLKVNVAAVGNWEIGRNFPSTDNLLTVAEFLGLDSTALGRGELLYTRDDETLGDAEVIGNFPLPSGPLDIPLLGGSYGGDDADFTFNGEVSGYVKRPPGIAHLRNVFATHVLSDSMSPRYEPGEILYLGGREPTPGDFIVIEKFPENEGEAGKAFVKKLKQRTATEIITEQFNPPKEVRFDRRTVKTLWRVIPWPELLGF